MDEPKHVAERYDWKCILIIAQLKVVLDYIFYMYIFIYLCYYWNATGMSHLKITWKLDWETNMWVDEHSVKHKSCLIIGDIVTEKLKTYKT